MSKVIRIDQVKQRHEESEDTAVDELFDSIIEKNRAVKERLAKERAEANQRTLRNYRIKK